MIAANVAVVDPDAVSTMITAIAEVQPKDERAPTSDRAKALFRGTPEVQQCFYVTGGISSVLVIVAPNMPTHEGLTLRLFAENELVTSYRSLIALDRVKAGTAIVVPQEPGRASLRGRASTSALRVYAQGERAGDRQSVVANEVARPEPTNTLRLGSCESRIPGPTPPYHPPSSHQSST